MVKVPASLVIPKGIALRRATTMAVRMAAATPKNRERSGVALMRALALPTAPGKSNHDPVSRPGKAIPSAKSVPKKA
jgi:hypothetical protein